MKKNLLLLLLVLVLVPAWVVAEPVAIQGGVQNVDLPLSQADLIHLEIKEGFFDEYSVGRLTVDMHNVNLRDGQLNSLEMGINHGEFDYVFVDQLNLKTASFSFDTSELLNHQRFVLDQPVNGSVSVVMTEAGMNRFIQEKRVREKIEKAIQKKTGGLKLITFESPKIELLRKDEMKLSVLLTVGGGIQMPVDMLGKLTLKNGNLNFTNLRLVSTEGGEVPLPVDVAQLFEDQINDMLKFSRLGKGSLNIVGDKLNLTTKKIEIAGHATMTKLEFGKRK